MGGASRLGIVWILCVCQRTVAFLILTASVLAYHGVPRIVEDSLPQTLREAALAILEGKAAQDTKESKDTKVRLVRNALSHLRSPSTILRAVSHDWEFTRTPHACRTTLRRCWSLDSRSTCSPTSTTTDSTSTFARWVTPLSTQG